MGQSAVLTVGQPLPLTPKEQTSSPPVGVSQRCRYCSKRRKSNDVENFAKVDFQPTPLRQYSVAPIHCLPIAEVGPARSPRQRGREARAAFAINYAETLAKTVEQLDQHYKCCGRNPGKCPDTRRMVFASRTGSRDIAHDRYLCIAV